MSEIDQTILDVLGVAFDGCDYQFQGLSYEDAGGVVWCGLFGFCGCGNREDHLNVLLSTLHKMYRWHTQNEYSEYTPEEELWLYFLDLYGFTEHGSSIFGSWLTDKGKSLKYILEMWNKD